MFPYDVVNPQSNTTVVVALFALTIPFNTAEDEVILVAADVVIVGTTAGVVKDTSEP